MMIKKILGETLAWYYAIAGESGSNHMCKRRKGLVWPAPAESWPLAPHFRQPAPH